MSLTPEDRLKIIADLTCAFIASGHYTKLDDNDAECPELLRLDDESPPYAVEDAIETAKFLFKASEPTV